jgi:carbamoyltransferase
MEFGPRALGSRSILADPRRPEMQSVVNLKVKFRESFRPFAPAVLAEHAAAYFSVPPGFASPYMLQVAAVRPERRCAPADSPRQGLDRVHELRSDIPAVTHLDYSARVQTVAPEHHPALHRLLTAFHALTGCPVLINTSFNVRGEPIVASAADAYRCFLATGIDVLVLEDFVLLKAEQPAAHVAAAAPYVQQLPPD